MTGEHDIEILFRRIEERFKDNDENSRKMLKMLVTVTMAYRSQLVAEKRAPLTVGETREALDAFMEIIQTQRFPVITKARIKELVMMWLQELRTTVHH